MNNKRWSLLAIILIIIGFAGMAYQSFNFGDEDPYHEQKWTLEALNSLTVESGYDIDVEVIESTNGTNYIEIRGNMAEDTINRLKKTTVSGPNVNLDLSRSNKWSFMVINFQSSKQHMTVALTDPAMIDQINFKLHSNSGQFKGLSAKNIELTTSSGNLTASSITSEHLTMKATSGNLKASEIKGETEIRIGSGNVKVEQIQGNLTAHGTSGELSVEDAEGAIDAKLSSGNIRLKNFTGDGVIKSTSGNITLTNQRSDSLDISLTSGNITLSADPEFKGIYDLKSSTGNVKAPDSPMQTRDVIKARTTSGNIKIQ